MSAIPSTPIRLCSQCHAQVVLEATASTCPACGSQLIADPTATAHTPPAQPITPQTDHRGIVLPARHAVGGIITPR